jgi:hypothetical protein
MAPSPYPRAEGRVSATAQALPYVPIATVVEVVCRVFGVHLDELRGPARTRSLGVARAAVALLARELSSASWPEVDHAIGRRSTARDRVDAARRLLSDPRFAATVELARAALTEGV